MLYIYTYMHTYIHAYIYRERERCRAPRHGGGPAPRPLLRAEDPGAMRPVQGAL